MGESDLRMALVALIFAGVVPAAMIIVLMLW
jgi:hypothetical protein